MLGWYDNPQALQRLVELAKDVNVRARRDALKGLLWTDHPEAEHILQRALSDENSKVRRWAERGLAIIAQLKRVMRIEG